MQDTVIYTAQGCISFEACAPPVVFNTGFDCGFALVGESDFKPVSGDYCPVDWSGAWAADGPGGVFCFGERVVKGFAPCPEPVTAFCEYL